MSVAAPAALLAHLALVEGALLSAAAAALVGHALHARRRARLDRARFAVLHRLTSLRLAEGTGRLSSALLRSMPFRLQVRLLQELAPSLVGAQRARLTELMTRVGVTERAERWCGSRRWWRRLQGLRLLTQLRAGAAIAPALLNDPRPEVRAQAIEWVTENPDPALIDQLLRLLDGSQMRGLLPVKDALVRIGRPCLGALTHFLSDRRGSALQAGLEVAVVLTDPMMFGPALTATTDEDPHTRALAAALIAAVGGTDAVDRLAELLDDQHPDVRAAAVRGLGRLEYWPAAAQVARLLSDPAWDVRSEAALTLKALGSTGLLLLHRALMNDDPFARDAARRVLDLPDARPELAA
ncbi:HEAT repeat domain-containing protein [Blastococcus saxobsidens]|uniref:HEAT repeat domain-containing protein n=1 Tax=Blastococcus saxobsidens (strain DD2) TaxID=1146883 RepID=H6RP37_BLASD|nr:HEAT repeat domain-containing protein [Blastococcus saxobsidens]CCG02698.1 membrane protein of unknown function; putative PBS lyase HEAT-like repeat domain [Blastococcus saxobsidens DD2]